MSSLPVIYAGRGTTIVDIVCIPGLPDLVPEYRVKDHNRWLRDVLSHQIPDARIMSFYYDFAKNIAAASWKDLIDQTLHFLFALRRRREETLGSPRPLVFMCFSFGSVILKKALLVAMQEPEFRQIFDNTVGILFLGSVHNEDHPSFEELALRCAAIEFRTTASRGSIIDQLRVSGGFSALKATLGEFRDLQLGLTVRTFYEIKKSVYQSSRWAPAKASCVCPESLATLGWTNELVIPVDLDHVQLSMFPNRMDDFFETLVSHLNDITTPCNPTIPNNPPQAAVEGLPLLMPFTASSIGARLPSSLSDISDPSWVANVKLPCFVTAPYEENPYFTGREQFLDAIENAFETSAGFEPRHKSIESQQPFTFALCGLGGMGKTQIALRYIFSHVSNYSVILWAHADSRVKLSDSYSRFANELRIEVFGSGEDSTILAVKKFLKMTSEKWLLVFDNLDDDPKGDLLDDFWPSAGNGSIILTSRNNSLIRKFGGIEIKELEIDSAVVLLKRLSRVENAHRNHGDPAHEDSAARELVQRIGCFPLGIGQAANLILNDSCLFSEFLAGYENEDLMRDQTVVPIVSRKAFQYQHSLGTVWNTNFDKLAADEQKLLNIIAFGDPDRFQLRILSDGAGKSEEPDFVFINNARKIHKCSMSLLRSSLVRRNTNLQEVESSSKNGELRELGMHRLVQVSCHVRMSHAERCHHFRLAVGLLKRSWPVASRHATYDPSLWPVQRLLLPHIQSLCRYFKLSCDDNQPLLPQGVLNWDFPQLLYNAGWFCWEKGMHEMGREVLELAKEYYFRHTTTSAEKDHVLLADIYGGLGSMDSETNNFQGTYNNFQSQWAELEAAFETGQIQRPSIMEVFGLGRVANGLMALNRFEQAEEYYRRCFHAWEGLPGDRLIWTSNMAKCLCLQHKLEEAETLLLPLLENRSDMSSFRPGVGLSTLASIKIAQGDVLLRAGNVDAAEKKFDAAYTSFSQAYANFQKVLGTHRRTADVCYHLGVLSQRRREYGRAIGFLEQALETFRLHKWFKNDVARATYRLGSVFQDMGDLAKGRSLIHEAEILRKELVSPEEWAPATSEDCYDHLIMFWSR